MIDDQRRAGEGPNRQLGAGIGRGVARPDHTAGPGVESVQGFGGAECVDASVIKGGRRARAGATVRLIESDGVAVGPYGLAGSRFVAGDEFVFAALLLCVKEAAVNGERRPGRSNGSPPYLSRRRCRPVGLDSDAGDDVVAMRSPKTRPFGVGSRRRWGGGDGLGERRLADRRLRLRGGWLRAGLFFRCRRWCNGLWRSLRQQLFFGTLRPAPGEL